MRIGIEINGVLRDTIGKFKQIYEKEYLGAEVIETPSQIYSLDSSGNTEEILPLKPFKYEIISEVDSLELENHFSFQSKEELYSFMFEEYVMELFGHAPSTEYTTFNDLNDLYLKIRDNHELIIISDEIGKSKPASLFFLSKFGCLLEKVVFYSNSTINSMWDEIDLLLTANPNLLFNHPSDKKVIKFETVYNKNINSENSILSIKEFENKINEITNVENSERTLLS
jgi:hypothetical protein